MTRRQKILAAGIVLLLLALVFWRQGKHSQDSNTLITPPGAIESAPNAPLALPVGGKAIVPITPAKQSSTASASSSAPTPTPTTLPQVLPQNPTGSSSSAVFVVPAGQEGMHRELIPRDISIVRVYYEQEIVAPGTRFGFDINGSGFNEAFYNIITIDADALDVEVKDLRLVTANQIHGEIEVGRDATTQYIYPKVLIRHLPVFKAVEPFGVVRPREVLDIQLVSIDESGQSGRFDVITNLTPADMKRFRVTPSTDKLEIANLTAKLPHHIEGLMEISKGLTNGQYGLSAYLGSHELFRKDPLVDVVRPNVGRTGSVENLKIGEPARRPGDSFQVTMRGSGFSPSDARWVTAQISKININTSTVAYVSAGRMELTFQLPDSTPMGVYGITVFNRGKEVHKQDAVFIVVPPNWLAGVRSAQPLRPGSSGLLQIQGRDLSSAFVQELQITMDDPGITLSPLRLQDPFTIAADVQIAKTVAPGDYILHITRQGKAVQLPRGSIIKVTQ